VGEGPATRARHGAALWWSVGLATAAAIAVAVVIGTSVGGAHHATACDRYSQALTRALEDPLGTPDRSALATLSPGDRASVAQSRAALASEVVPTTVACNVASCLVDPPGRSAHETPQERRGLARWSQAVPRLRAMLLAHRGC